jgi:hypothetical protein
MYFLEGLALIMAEKAEGLPKVDELLRPLFLFRQ